MLTCRNYKKDEFAKLTALADKYGVKGIKRNVDTYSKIGMVGWWHPKKSLHMGLHLMNPARGTFAVNVLKKFRVSKKEPILDIGCGGGILSEFLAKNGYKVVGVDLSKGAINVARQHAKKARLDIRYSVGSVYKLNFPKNHFAAVVCCDFLEHIEDLDKAVSEISRVLRPSGPLVFDTIARDKESVKQFMLRERDGRIPAGTHDPKLFIYPNEIVAVAKRYGIEIAKDRKNPFGIAIKTMESFKDKFRLRSVKAKRALGHYLGYGVKF